MVIKQLVLFHPRPNGVRPGGLPQRGRRMVVLLLHHLHHIFSCFVANSNKINTTRQLR